MNKLKFWLEQTMMISFAILCGIVLLSAAENTGKKGGKV